MFLFDLCSASSFCKVVLFRKGVGHMVTSRQSYETKNLVAMMIYLSYSRNLLEKRYIEALLKVLRMKSFKGQSLVQMDLLVVWVILPS